MQSQWLSKGFGRVKPMSPFVIGAFGNTRFARPAWGTAMSCSPISVVTIHKSVKVREMGSLGRV